MCVVCFFFVFIPHYKALSHRRSGIHHELVQSYLGSPTNKRKKLSISHNKSEGHMLTRHHSQSHPRDKCICVHKALELQEERCAVHPVLLVTCLVFIYAYTHNNNLEKNN